jgi:hypothetical protein
MKVASINEAPAKRAARWQLPKAPDLEDPLMLGAIVAAAGVLIAVLALAHVFGGGGSSVKLYQGVPAVQDDNSFWRSVDPRVSTKTVGAPGGNAAGANLGQGRASFTALQWTFAKAQTFYGHRWLFVTFKGNATGNAYTFFVDFKPRHANSAGYTIVDTSNAWRAVAMDLTNPDLGKGPFDLRHVISVRMTTDSKDQTGSFDVGRMTLSPSS